MMNQNIKCAENCSLLVNEQDVEQLFDPYGKWLSTNMDHLLKSLENLVDPNTTDIIEVAGRLIWKTAQAVPETLKNDCMIGQTWFMKGTSVSALIEYAENVYKAEAVAQNSKIEFGTDDNEHWFAHDVPFYGTVQIDRIEEHGLVEWEFISMNVGKVLLALNLNVLSI